MTVVELTVVGDGEGISFSMSLMEWFPQWMCRVREVADLNEWVHCGLGQLSNGTFRWEHFVTEIKVVGVSHVAEGVRRC